MTRRNTPPTLEPAIRLLAPYTDFYNFKCEQNGPRAYGFGTDGERLKEYGIHGDLWARNHYEANKLAHDLVKKIRSRRWPRTGDGPLASGHPPRALTTPRSSVGSR